MVDVWVFYESLPVDDTQRSRLSRVERGVAAICDLRQEVNSGGFDVYFRYWGGDTAPTAAATLDEVLGADWSSLLREAMGLLGPDYPTDPGSRFELLADLDIDAELEAIDKRYYELEGSTEADQLLSRYLSHRD